VRPVDTTLRRDRSSEEPFGSTRRQFPRSADYSRSRPSLRDPEPTLASVSNVCVVAGPPGGSIIAEVPLLAGERSLRVTIESGDALSTPGDVLVLKHAQGNYGVDKAVVDRLKRSRRELVDSLPPPGRHLAVAAEEKEEFAVPLILFIGTPAVDQFGYDTVRTWAREALSALAEINPRAETAITTIHGVRISGPSLDEARSLKAQLAGFHDGLARGRLGPNLKWIRVIERDAARAQRLAGALDALSGVEFGMGLLDETQYSSSVLRVRGAFDPSAEVTASALAQLLQQAYPEYANGILEKASFDVDAGPPSPVDDWLERVRALYEPEALARSRHEVVDGPLLLAGLATLDGELRRTLDESGVTEPLWTQLELKPHRIGMREDVPWTPDKPATADYLGRRVVAEALYDGLKLCDSNYSGSSFLVHIDGKWGVGKSTLLRFLVDYARHERWCVIEFDAWRQARAGPPWRLLLTALRATLWQEHRMSFPTALRERWHLLGRPYQAASLAFVVVVALLAGLWVSGVTDFDTVSSATLGVVALIAALWAASKAIGRFFAFDSWRGATTFVDTRRDPMEALARHFQWLRRQSRNPLLLVIDDLDRCDHEYVVELLDHTQKLLREEPTVSDKTEPPTLFIVVAADGRWLRRSYEVAHASFTEDIGEPGRPLGSLFVDKLFQLRVPVPELSPSKQETFLRRVLRVQDSGDWHADEGDWPSGEHGRREAELEQLAPGLVEQIEAAATSDEVIKALDAAPPELRIRYASRARKRLKREQEAEHALVRFAPLLEPNPRSILRFTMAFDILRAARLADGSEPVPTDRLALWAIISVRWPVLAEFLQRDPDAVKLFLTGADELDGRVPDELHQVLADPSLELRKVFIDQPGGPLTADLIRKCAGVA
jgi:hypothetical protein